MVTNDFPKDWKNYTLDQVSSKLVVGFVGTCEKYYTNGSTGVMMIRTGDLKEKSIDYSNVRFISQNFHEKNLKSQLKRGDILIARHGSSGHGVIYDLDKDANALNIVIVRVNPSSMHNVFLKYLLDSTYVSKQVAELSAGSTQNVINTSQLAKLNLFCPSCEEQKMISNTLADIDDLISHIARLITKKKAIKQSAMQKLLTGKLRLPGFEGKWLRCNLMEHSKIKARIGWQGLKKSEYLDSGYAILVTGTDFEDGRVVWDTCHYIDKRRYDLDKNIQIQNNDILITKDGSLGKTALVKGLNGRATLNSGVFVIRPLAEVYTPEFVYHILDSFIFKEFLDQLSAGSTIIHLYQKDLNKFEFLIPPTHEEQIAISNVLSEMDDSIRETEQMLKKYRQVKQGMMQQLLTGKIRLTD